MRILSALKPKLAGAAVLSAALLLGAAAPSAWAQQVKAEAAGRNVGVFHPPRPPRPINAPPMPAPSVMAPPVRPIGGPARRPVAFTPPPIPRVQPIAMPPVFPPIRVIPGAIGAGGAQPISPAGPGAIAPLRFPPESRRLALAAPPVSNPLPPSFFQNPTLPLASHIAGIASPLPPPGSQVYCSPLSVMYNTGSICFNPNLYTIDPAFFPWGLWSPPPFINVPGFVSPFVPGLLIQYCPQCAAGSLQLFTEPTPFGEEGLHPLGLPPDLFSNPAFEVKPAPEPPVTAPTADIAVSGPPVALVLENGSTVLVSRYWLGQDWLLHFVTVTGERNAIPLNALNLKSTGAVNYARGVTFVLPAWPEPRARN